MAAAHKACEDKDEMAVGQKMRADNCCNMQDIKTSRHLSVPPPPASPKMGRHSLVQTRLPWVTLGLTCVPLSLRYISWGKAV